MRTNGPWLGQVPLLGQIDLEQGINQFLKQAWEQDLRQAIDQAAAELKSAADSFDRLEANGADVDQLREAGGRLNDALNRYDRLKNELARGMPGPRKFPSLPPEPKVPPPAPPAPVAASGGSSDRCPPGQFWDGFKCRGSVSAAPGLPGGFTTPTEGISTSGVPFGLTGGKRSWLGQVPLVLGPSSWGAGAGVSQASPQAVEWEEGRGYVPYDPIGTPPYWGEWGVVGEGGVIKDSGKVGPFDTIDEAFSAAADAAVEHGATALPGDGWAQVKDSRGKSKGPIT